MKKLTALTLFVIATSAYALDGIQFQHKDWEIACDNTGTCRMAGYNEDPPEGLLVSVLLTRAAGNAETLAYFNIMPTGEEYAISNKSPPDLAKIHLWIDEKDLGLIKQEQKGSYEGQFSPAQTQALLKALKGSAKIKLVATLVDNSLWEKNLSTQGANAVMLKADEFQRRLNTPSALIRKGSQTGNVLQPQPLPVVNVARVKKADMEIKPTDPKYTEILKLLKSVYQNDDSCYQLYHPLGDEPFSLFVFPLDKENVLLSTVCDVAAYNETNVNLVLSADLSKINQVLDARGEYAGNGEILGSWKSRGMGDCGVIENWAWDGSVFRKTKSATTGDCRNFPGGAWDLPTYKSKVNNPNAN